MPAYQGKPGVPLVVPGVGLYNAASGLTTTYSRSTPALLVAGQIPRAQQFAFIYNLPWIRPQEGLIQS